MFIMTCFTMNFRKRPSAVELYQHKWCSSYLSTNSSRLSTATMKSFSRKLRQVCQFCDRTLHWLDDIVSVFMCVLDSWSESESNIYDRRCF